MSKDAGGPKKPDLRVVPEKGPQRKRYGPEPGTHMRRAHMSQITVKPQAPGYRLVQKLFQEIETRRLTLQEAASEIGISQSLLGRLRNGSRRADQVDASAVRAIAVWMGIPPLAGMMLAEMVTIKDYYAQSGMLEHQINRALAFVARDEQWGSIMPHEVDQWGLEAKLWAVWCYEQATQTKLIGGGVDYRDLLEQLRQFREETPPDE